MQRDLSFATRLKWIKHLSEIFNFAAASNIVCTALY